MGEELGANCELVYPVFGYSLLLSIRSSMLDMTSFLFMLELMGD